jgi:hypothetical protein
MVDAGLALIPKVYEIWTRRTSRLANERKALVPLQRAAGRFNLYHTRSEVRQSLPAASSSSGYRTCLVGWWVACLICVFDDLAVVIRISFPWCAVRVREGALMSRSVVVFPPGSHTWSNATIITLPGCTLSIPADMPLHLIKTTTVVLFGITWDIPHHDSCAHDVLLARDQPLEIQSAHTLIVPAPIRAISSACELPWALKYAVITEIKRSDHGTIIEFEQR